MKILVRRSHVTPSPSIPFLQTTPKGPMAACHVRQLLRYLMGLPNFSQFSHAEIRRKILTPTECHLDPAAIRITSLNTEGAIERETKIPALVKGVVDTISLSK